MEQPSGCFEPYYLERQYTSRPQRQQHGKYQVKLYQSNHEGDLVDYIQEAYFEGVSGIVINPGAYTHTSVALLDAVKSVRIPTVEVHISKVEEREDFRQISYVRLACVKTITGHGTDGYLEAIDFLTERE